MGEYSERNEFDFTKKAVGSALKKIDNFKTATENMNFMMGFDGYVDLLYNMVKNRNSLDDVVIYNSMADFGQKIVETAGSSGSIERVLKKKLGGGFAPNMARAIGNMAPTSTVDLYAAMGYPEILDVFKELPENVNLHTIGNPGETLAMEFDDGKIMSQDMGGIFELTWDTLVSRMGGRDKVIEAFEKADAIGNGHWSLMLTMSSFFQHFVDDILPNVKNPKDKLFFVDPADLNKRPQKDIREMLFLLREINEYSSVVLSVNDREAINIAEALESEGCPEIGLKNHKSYTRAGCNINEITQLDYFVIHDPHFATITESDANDACHYWVTEGYTSKPQFTVAAGDHFNAAILMSLLSDFNPSEALVMANAATAIFVRTGISPNVKALKKFVAQYFDYILNDIWEFEFPK